MSLFLSIWQQDILDILGIEDDKNQENLLQYVCEIRERLPNADDFAPTARICLLIRLKQSPTLILGRIIAKETPSFLESFPDFCLLSQNEKKT